MTVTAAWPGSTQINVLLHPVWNSGGGWGVGGGWGAFAEPPMLPGTVCALQSRMKSLPACLSSHHHRALSELG